MSIRTSVPRSRFRPESAEEFSSCSRRLSRWLGLPYQRSQELLARIYGYSGLHELQKELERPGAPGPFDSPDFAHQGRSGERGSRIVRLLAVAKGVSEAQLTERDRAVLSMGLFRRSSEHRAIFNALRASEPAMMPPGSRRVISAPAPSAPGLCATFVDVECATDEDVEWLWTVTPTGRYVSGYRIVPGSQVHDTENVS